MPEAKVKALMKKMPQRKAVSYAYKVKNPSKYTSKPKGNPHY